MKNKVRKGLGILMILLSVCCIGFIVWYEYHKADNADVYSKVQKEAVDNKKKDTDSSDNTEQKDTYVSPIDFDSLKETNPDIYAWIEIPNTKINYPIVQSAEDDTYYLNHTIDGKSGYPGSIYTESLNAKDFSDYNTVIYGHNMKDGSMFQGLHAYEDPQYLTEHPYVYIYTSEKKLTYRIFAAVVYGNEHILNSYDFTDAYQRQLYLNSVLGSRNMKDSRDESVQVDTDSHILTLSTCIGGQPENRYIVEAVLTDE